MYPGSNRFKAQPNIRELTALLSPNSQVLDMGAWEGYNGNFIAQHGHRVVSVDNNFESVLVGSKLLKSLGNQAIRNSFVCGDMLEPMFADESFDAVISTISLQHVTPLDNAVLALRRLMALTKPGGLNLVHIYIGNEETQRIKAGKFSVFGPGQLKGIYDAANWQCLSNPESQGPLELNPDGSISTTAQVIARKPA